jgi:hypothetical protein
MNILKFVMGFVISIMTVSAYAGTEGHGGGAFVCSRPDGSIAHAELLDLWEGKFKGHHYFQGTDVEALRKKALDRIPLDFPAELIEDEVNWGLKHQIILPAGQGLPPPPDAKNSYEDLNCPLKGVARWHDIVENFTNKSYVEIVPSILAAMDPLNQAALFVHEGVYSWLRQVYGDVNSIRARDITSCLFAENCEPSKLIPLTHKVDKTLALAGVRKNKTSQPGKFVLDVLPSKTSSQRIQKVRFSIGSLDSNGNRGRPADPACLGQSFEFQYVNPQTGGTEKVVISSYSNLQYVDPSLVGVVELPIPIDQEVVIQTKAPEVHRADGYLCAYDLILNKGDNENRSKDGWAVYGLAAGASEFKFVPKK